MRASTLATLSDERRDQVVQQFRGLQTTRPVRNFIRVIRRAHSRTPLGCSGGPSRFSPLPPNQGSAGLFGVVYLASDLGTAVYETLIRNRFDLNPSRVLTPPEYSDHDAVNVSTSIRHTVMLLDLSQGNAIRCGVPTDVIRYSMHSDGQYFSEFVHEAMPTVDGFAYNSRLTEGLCIAIYDRAIHKLAAAPPTPLSRSLLTAALQTWNVSVH